MPVKSFASMLARTLAAARTRLMRIGTELSGGKATLTTVQGEPLSASMQGGKLVLTDAKGGTSTVPIKDVMQSNGVIHVVDTVLMP